MKKKKKLQMDRKKKLINPIYGGQTLLHWSSYFISLSPVIDSQFVSYYKLSRDIKLQ